jgi:hypothetical protein
LVAPCLGVSLQRFNLVSSCLGVSPQKDESLAKAQVFLLRNLSRGSGAVTYPAATPEPPVAASSQGIERMAYARSPGLCESGPPLYGQIAVGVYLICCNNPVEH